jgi:EmrB/QacA subfamily drug resistance transporter
MRPRTNRPTPTIAAKGISSRELSLVITALFVATLLAALDQTIFSTALPTIVGDLDGVDQMLWVTTAYILAATIMMPVYGKLGDLIGHKLLFLTSLVLFLAGSVLGGIAGSMPFLIAARAVQGLGGGGLMILSLAIVADVVPPRKRGTYMGIMASAWAFASVLGPILGGWFSGSIGWRWAFWFNLPLGVLAIVVASAFLRTPRERSGRPVLDIPGMITMAIATTAIILVISWGGREYSWGSSVILGLLGVAVAFGALLIVIERRAAEPIIPLHLFHDRNFNLATIGGLLSSIAFIGVVIYMPSYLQMVSGMSPTSSGLLLVPLTLGILASSMGSGIIASRTGRYRWMPAASGLVMAVSLYLLSTLTAGTTVWLACFYMFVCGVGTGIGFQILILIAQNSFALSEVGTATGAHNFFRQIGASLGSAVVGTLFTGRLVSLLAERLAASSSAGAAGQPGGPGLLDANSLTPALVNQLPPAVKNTVVTAYSDALTPIYRYIAPIMVIAGVLMLFVKEKPLATTNESPASAASEAPAPAATAEEAQALPSAPTSI